MSVKNNLLKLFLLLCLSIFAVVPMACGDDDDDGSGGDGDSDGDSDGDTDGDADSESESEGCVEITWGGGLNVGETVANWEMEGLVDQDGDGVIGDSELEPIMFTLEDVHCSGKQSLILAISDTT